MLGGLTNPEQAELHRLLVRLGRHLKNLNVIDDVIPEPLGGAHRDPREMGTTLKSYLLRYLRQLRGKSVEELLNERYDKFRRMGVFETAGGSPAAVLEAAS